MCALYRTYIIDEMSNQCWLFKIESTLNRVCYSGLNRCLDLNQNSVLNFSQNVKMCYNFSDPELLSARVTFRRYFIL